MAVHEAALVLLAGAAHLQRRGLHLRGARPALLQDRQLREPLLQRAPAPGAADDEPRRAQVRRALHRDARARRARQDHPSREFILLCFFPESIQRELVRHDGFGIRAAGLRLARFSSDGEASSETCAG